MATMRFGLFLIIACLCSSAQALYGPSSDVLQLSASNFESKVLKAKGVVIVEFYASWCGHCKALAPAWEKAATALKGIVQVAALDADTHKALAQEYGISGFPSIKVFLPGKPPLDYQGPREAKGIVEYALQQVKTLAMDRLKNKSSSNGKEGAKEGKEGRASASVELTPKNFDDLVTKSGDLWLVEFFAPWCGHCKKLAPEWKTAAKRLQGKVKLGQVDCDAHKEFASRFDIKGFPTILLFGADKDHPTPYQGAREASTIESYALEQLENNVAPVELVELTGPKALEKNCASSPICLVAFLPHILDSKAEGRKQYLDILQSVADKLKKTPYGYVWAEAGKHASLEEAVGVGGYGYPALVAVSVKKSVFVPFKSSFESASVLEFVKDVGRGGKGTLPLNAEIVVVETEPWDGKDGEAVADEEFSLDELMADDTPREDL